MGTAKYSSPHSEANIKEKTCSFDNNNKEDIASDNTTAYSKTAVNEGSDNLLGANMAARVAEKHALDSEQQG